MLHPAVINNISEEIIYTMSWVDRDEQPHSQLETLAPDLTKCNRVAFFSIRRFADVGERAEAEIIKACCFLSLICQNLL